jgi:hypothetical protein
MTDVRPEKGSEHNEAKAVERPASFDNLYRPGAGIERPAVSKADYMSSLDAFVGTFKNAHPEAQAMFLEYFKENPPIDEATKSHLALIKDDKPTSQTT